MIDDDEIRAKLETIGITPNPARATRGNPTKQASRGSSNFEKLLKVLAREWELDEDELDAIEEIRIIDGVYEIRDAGSKTWEELVDE